MTIATIRKVTTKGGYVLIYKQNVVDCYNGCI